MDHTFQKNYVDDNIKCFATNKSLHEAKECIYYMERNTNQKLENHKRGHLNVKKMTQNRIKFLYLSFSVTHCTEQD